MAVFTYKPQTAQLSIKPRVQETRYGDGYVGSVGDGINTMPKTWNLTFGKVTPEAAGILAFLGARAGVEAFDWTDPDGDTGRYVCPEWNSTPGVGHKEITATFEQRYGV